MRGDRPVVASVSRRGATAHRDGCAARLPHTGACPMPISMRVLSDDDRTQIHEQSLAVLAKTGMRINSERARRILGEAGAQVDEADHRVRFPRALVEAALASAPKRFSLGGRRPGFALPMNAGECTLIPDGESTMFYDPVTGVRRVATREDWVAATKLVDTMDEVGAYWQMVTAGEDARGIGALVAHLVETFRLFSKHVQDAPGTVEEAGWLLELLAAIFGGREAVRRDHPYSSPVLPGLTAGDGGGAHGRLPRDGRLGHPDRDHADADDGQLGPGRAAVHRGLRQCRGSRYDVPRAGGPARDAGDLRARAGGDGAADRDGGAAAARSTRCWVRRPPRWGGSTACPSSPPTAAPTTSSPASRRPTSGR